MGKSKNNNKKTSIGGQAVLEGVMMRGKTSMATAVRDADGIIRVETKRLNDGKKPNRFLRLPLIRGVVSFGSSLFGGTRVLMRSAEVFGEGEPSKFEKWLAEKLKINVFTIVGFFSMVVALFLAVFLFMWIPQTVRLGLESLFGISFGVWAKNFIEGGLKLLVFILYILLASLLKDIKRTFMYHGAEHKTITCFESNMDLTVENARKCRRVHDRCGTTFIVFVMLISILVFACFESLVGENLNRWLRIVCKIAFLPVVAGISYELLKGLSKTENPIFLPLKIPGLLLQKVTTREPDDGMLEVAITAFKKVQEMEDNLNLPEVSFVVAKKRKEVTESVIKTLAENGIDERAEAEWIVSLKLGVKRDEVYAENLVSPQRIDDINKVVSERITGRPLWYCIGDADFYGYTIKVDESVLIPRPETEILVSNALKEIERKYALKKSTLNGQDEENGENNCKVKVLDLCTGSGAIAVAVKKEADEKVLVTATDVSDKAVEKAKENAKINNAQIEFVCGDLFENVNEKFDIILSNPPYIKSQDIDGLQKEVKDFEPILALDGGEDGLDFYKRICGEVREYLPSGGVLIMEVGVGQAQDVKQTFSEFSSVEIIKDYENIERIVVVVV